MKYHNLQAFYNHLRAPSQKGIPSVFLLISPCSYERKKIGEKIVAFLSSVKERVEFASEGASNVDLQKMIEDLNTISITASTKIIFLEGVDRLKKGDLALLAKYLESPSPLSWLILSAENAKGLSELQGKPGVIVCDLSSEKPWELKTRLKGFCEERAGFFSKQIAQDALELLLERVGLFLPNLEKEIDKLCCYVGERKTIVARDVSSLVSEQKETYLFTLLDQMIFTSSPDWVKEEEAGDLLFPLLSQLKNQLQQALAISLLLERKVKEKDLPFHFPLVKPYHLEKLAAKVRGKSPVFFRRALDLTFEMELLSKTANQDPPFLLDLLLAKMKLLRHSYS